MKKSTRFLPFLSVLLLLCAFLGTASADDKPPRVVTVLVQFTLPNGQSFSTEVPQVQLNSINLPVETPVGAKYFLSVSYDEGTQAFRVNMDDLSVVGKEGSSVPLNVYNAGFPMAFDKPITLLKTVNYKLEITFSTK